jgi:hypothetical protein
MLQGYLERRGRPLAFYTDKAGLFQVNRPANQDEELRGEAARTQIGRALDELGIEWIAAHSPQAKGRVERCFETLQDRLVKGLRVAGASSLEEANAYLEGEFLAEWEDHFAVQARNPTEAHRWLSGEHDLAAILSQVQTRVVTNDYTLRFEGRSYRIARQGIRAGLRGSRVRVEKRLDGTVAVKFRDHYLPVARCEAKPSEVATGAQEEKIDRPAPAKSKAKHASLWMKNFHLGQGPPLWAVLKHESGKGPARLEGR